MIKVTAVKPEERLRKIQDSIRSSAVGTDEISKAFDLKLNLDLMKISGRVLNPSPIAYEVKHQHLASLQRVIRNAGLSGSRHCYT